MGFPMEMFTVLFAIPRTSGWLAHWIELLGDKEQKIARPARSTSARTSAPTCPSPTAELTSRRLRPA
jgi:citrate synthase